MMRPFDAQDKQDHIRNFAIIAHIDHGKSTLADRLLEVTGTVLMRDMQEQLLDSNPIERERGITIKLAPVRMLYQSMQITNFKSQIPNKLQIQNSNVQNSLELGACDLELSSSKQTFVLNLIDTPGHVDFTYEVSRSLAACEGAVLVVDATQGVQAQTLANLHLAQGHNLVIIPVINKIDLPNARVEETKEELVALGFKKEDILSISAKMGTNIDQLLGAIVQRIPAPNGKIDDPLRALVFSSHYDAHKGVVVFVRVVDGSVGEVGTPMRLQFMASGAEVTPIELGYFLPFMSPEKSLVTGEVGYIATGLKDIRFAKVGDTITEATGDKRQETSNISTVSHVSDPMSHAITPLPGYREPKPMVFLGLFPINSDEITLAREAMEKLRLSDSAFTFRPISSLALGNGFHCGFLGLLHAEIVQERLSREFNLNMIATAPSVEYHITLTGWNPANRMQGSTLSIQSATEFPDPSMTEEVKEPVMEVKIFSPKRYVGAIMQLAQEKRGIYMDLAYIADQATFTYFVPLSEMIIDFFDRLKSVTEGYASLDYEFFEYQSVDVAKVDILVNHEKVDALSFLVVKDQAPYRARQITERLAAVIPRQQFEIPIQATIGGQVIARADVKSFRKDVIAKLYGGDRSRKNKLLDKQKKGKERMKMVGRVSIPQEAFFTVLKNQN